MQIDIANRTWFIHPHNRIISSLEYDMEGDQNLIIFNTYNMTPSKSQELISKMKGTYGEENVSVDRNIIIVQTSEDVRTITTLHENYPDLPILLRLLRMSLVYFIKRKFVGHA